MTPVLSAFSGHVPEALTKKIKGNWTRTARWFNFPSALTSVSLASFDDPIFSKIGVIYLQKQKELFGLSGMYSCDTFNEMVPNNGDFDYLADAGYRVYESIAKVDPDGIWVMQSWLFTNGWWNNNRISAYLSKVPSDKMIILDLQSERSPIWSRTKQYFGKPWIWNTLHNFG